ncbi:MAG: hypothetical protein ABII03_03235 [Nanoarchaeota archaeon]
MKKRLFLVSIFLIILISGVDARSCSIENSCNPDNTVMKLSADTNAHGELWNQGNYGKYLCCDFTTANPHVCSGGNKFLKLSSITNAHAEIPTGTAYGTNVCFGDLNCASAIGSCPQGKEILLRLSAETNAHISGASDTNYNTLICCDVSPCQLTSAKWSVDNATSGTNVGLIVTGNQCDGKEVKFEVFEKDLASRDPAAVNPVNAFFNNANSTTIWNAEWVDDGFLGGDPEYVFKASLVENPSVYIDASDELEVFMGATPCQFTSAKWSVDNVTNGTNVGLIVTGNQCDGKEVKFEVFEKELIGRNPAIVNPINVFFNGDNSTAVWNAEWVDDWGGNPEYVFKASLVENPSIYIDNSDELEVFFSDVDVCASVFSCFNYLGEGECEDDLCEIADASVEANNPFLTCGEEGVICFCEWLGSSCGSSSSIVREDVHVGNCSYSEKSGDNCDDGLLVYSWGINWIWGHPGWDTLVEATSIGPSTNEAYYVLENKKYYYDPNGDFEGCADGSSQIECPASIALPFFGIYQIIFVILILGVVYFRKGKKELS